jgi:hypothetical protein
MQQPLISKWATTPLDWIRMHPKSVPSSFLGASILPQEFVLSVNHSWRTKTTKSGASSVIRGNMLEVTLCLEIMRLKIKAANEISWSMS